MPPPGLSVDRGFSETISGGDVDDWVPFEEKRVYTNAFVVHDGKVSPSIVSRAQDG